MAGEARGPEGVPGDRSHDPGTLLPAGLSRTGAGRPHSLNRTKRKPFVEWLPSISPVVVGIARIADLPEWRLHAAMEMPPCAGFERQARAGVRCAGSGAGRVPGVPL